MSPPSGNPGVLPNPSAKGWTPGSAEGLQDSTQHYSQCPYRFVGPRVMASINVLSTTHGYNPEQKLDWSLPSFCLRSVLIRVLNRSCSEKQPPNLNYLIQQNLVLTVTYRLAVYLSGPRLWHGLRHFHDIPLAKTQSHSQSNYKES